MPTAIRTVDMRDARIDIIWNARDLELSDEARLALWLQKRIPTTGLGEA